MIHRTLPQTLLVLAVALTTSAADATVVKFLTPLGRFDVELYDDEAPLTVANFLEYVEDGDFIDSIIHRSAKTADSGVNVIQGGGFYDDFTSVPTNAPVVNEFASDRSNVRGTIAMARLGGQPDSATSQWFVNTTDNLALDGIDGGFTVFGIVLDNGMDVVDAIADLGRVNAGGAFGALPVLDVMDGTASDNLVTVDVYVVPEPSVLVLSGLALVGVVARRRVA
ncbi:Peptidyl-prolyl cis-trans isomerase A precursor [Pseudobythopirellula maris]|uniref:peptidylprolyl isomerase n=1 Tax=Pseudobythopirellula maris TaxID=2527991 RepID=A0A5C5ZN73_9BACT|nr:peptidylprolyl isomerase [Pseudobythopirellula maris]TWT88899.1 Peptidyl-prolyl cis-trans isomerase A precursor [Pseudobythopirellula maris]